MLELYFPQEMWELPNIYLAGVCQNMSIGPEETFVVLACSHLLGAKTLTLVEKILPKDFKNTEAISETRQSVLLHKCRDAVQEYVACPGAMGKHVSMDICPPIMKKQHQTTATLKQQKLPWAPTRSVVDVLPSLSEKQKK
jgi:hypothetical protein